MVLVAGDITMAELKPKLERVLGDWQRKPIEPTKFANVAPPAKPGVYVIDRPASVQTSLVMGNLAIKGNDPDRFAISVMNRILGGSPASRLFTNLREDKGYTYGAYSSVSINRYPGVASASAEVRTEVTEGAMTEFMKEFERIAKQPVSDIELANAKRAIVGGFALSLENPQSFLSNVYQQKLYGFPADYWEEYPKRIAAVTKEDVARVAAKYFDPSRMQIVAVGEAAKIRAAMAKFGAVEVKTISE
jgi:predicted Zn-dependent peptidase